MGLVGFLLTPLFVGRHTTLLRTEDFATRPLAWLRALSETRATITGGPPSAYALCARRVRQREAAELDLGALRIALVGAEPIPPQVLEAFAERFATSGFDRRAWLPTYGLAENVLAVTMPPLRREPVFDAVDLTSLERDGVATPVVAGRDRSRSVAAVGPPLPGLSVEILGPDGRSLPERHVGEVAVAGPTLMTGYLDDPGASRDAIPDGRLRTGDLSYLAGGELHVVGRQKELIIVGGRNHHPEEIEAAAATVQGVRSGRAVAVGIRDETAATDRVIVLVETAIEAAEARDRLRQEVRLAVTRAGCPVDEVRLLPPRSIRTTTSGKLRRLEWRQRSLEHGLADTD
jgi:acyl-CoA synthetase (AMP-forming)/AMP-acid ligase II